MKIWIVSIFPFHFIDGVGDMSCFLSCDKCTYCKSLCECPKCKCRCKCYLKQYLYQPMGELNRKDKYTTVSLVQKQNRKAESSRAYSWVFYTKVAECLWMKPEIKRNISNITHWYMDNAFSLDCICCHELCKVHKDNDQHYLHWYEHLIACVRGAGTHFLGKQPAGTFGQFSYFLLGETVMLWPLSNI